MNENKRIDNPQMKIVKCVVAELQVLKLTFNWIVTLKMIQFCSFLRNLWLLEPHGTPKE